MGNISAGEKGDHLTGNDGNNPKTYEQNSSEEETCAQPVAKNSNRQKRTKAAKGRPSPLGKAVAGLEEEI